MDIQIKRRFNEKELPDMATNLHEAQQIASNLTIGTTLFMKKYNVRSEVEFKKRMMAEGKIMKHSVIGWNSWDATEEGFKTVYDSLTNAGSFITRFGACFDWSMGVPEEYRNRIQAAGGLIFKTQEEWNRLGQVVPVQPHLGDHMIGSLNSVSNCVNGLKAGVTTIGNLAHYYTFEYPGFDMEYLRTTEYMKSIAIMGQFKDQGVFIHSNLDDGYGAQFHDLANLLGWAKIERYIAEELLGARVGHCFGNLFSNPYSRMVFNRAVDKVNTYKTPGSFMNGNTIDYGMDISKNYGALCSYSMADIICQMKHPTGHAIAPVPLTEAIRVPSAEEMVQAHMTVDMMIEKAPYYMDMVDWDKIEDEADLLVVGANVFFERVMNALDDLGVDICHAGEIAAVLKAIGPEQLESAFGAGKKDENAMRGRIPVRPTSIVQTIGSIQDDVLAKQNYDKEEPLKNVNVVIGATDVHEFGKEVIKNVLKSAGAMVFDLGTTVAATEVADIMIETGCKIVCISTYNGMAYSFGKELRKSLDENGLQDVKIIMGGRLNENMDGADLPEDVSDKLKELGINTDNDVDTIVATIEQLTA